MCGAMAVATLAAAPVALPYGYGHSYNAENAPMAIRRVSDIVIRLESHKHRTHTSLQHRLKYMLQQVAGIVLQRLDCGPCIILQRLDCGPCIKERGIRGA